MGIDLPLIWFAIIIFATLMYIVMDGFDLGRYARARYDGEHGRSGLGRQ